MSFDNYLDHLPLNEEDRTDIIMYVFEEFKSIHGVKARHIDFDNISDEDLIKQANYLEADIKESIRKDREHNEKVKHALANPDRYIVDLVGFDRGNEYDAMYIDAMERSGDYSHFVVYEKPTFKTNTLAEAFKGIKNLG